MIPKNSKFNQIHSSFRILSGNLQLNQMKNYFEFLDFVQNSVMPRKRAKNWLKCCCTEL